MKILLLTTTLLFSILLSFGQTKGTLYKADKWADVKGKGDWVKAMNSPNKEKVEVLLTIKSIKVTFGAKTYDYKLVSFYRASPVMWVYIVNLDGKTYKMNISQNSLEINNESYTINIENEWMITKIADVSALDIK